MNTSDITYLKMYYDNNSKKNNSEWYDRVYLCYENTNSNPYSPIKGFDCYRYDSFENADSNCRFNKLTVRHTMIPMCKWVPEIFDKYILGWKLRKLYWGGQISIGRGYNKYK